MTAAADVLTAAAAWLAEGDAVAFAVVTDTWGSSPCPVGSRMAISARGRLAGSVSAGCVEGAVVRVAQEVLASGEPRQLAFAVSDNEAWGAGLTCGGRLEVLVAKLTTAELLASLLAARQKHEPAVLATRLAEASTRLLAPPFAGDGLGRAAAAALQRRQSRTVVLADGAWLLEVFAPPPRLLLIGAVHIAQVLVPMATALEFAVTVIDPRQAFATAERFPSAALRIEWPDEAFDSLAPDRQTAVVTLSHDPKLDDPALDRALRSEAFYIAALGSRDTHAQRLRRLADLGHDTLTLARIYAPAGLALGAVTPAEIALAIAAELLAVWRGAPLARRPRPE